MVGSRFPGDDQPVARILNAVEEGVPEASSQLLPLVYGELRKLAAARMARLSPGQTLQATALVHEAYVRLVGRTNPGWQGRAHSFCAATRAMRGILADHLQKKGSPKRGGHLRRLDMETMAELSGDGPNGAALAVEEALQALEQVHQRKAEVVTLMFFGGLTAKEIGEVLSVSSRTVESDWRFAKAWLNRWLADREEE
ncbi:ECF-type sigma factor [Engelhardtia mirabilis]|uniref:RNA polymerase sigma factor n=1 Tax=Engelhardtia mirabilis TaxID=2528011 RepID=A0A518BMI8_9BACT|nr:RNA polymerase sigma factor [Planctomycetes bacterium Pla133]QDV02524.1 RNA polymerase sigma factor [Planctomycetes bacterium Pla86]